MTTTVTKTIGSAAGRDYSTFASAFAALPASLVTVDQQWIFEAYNDSQFTSANVTLTGVTTDATRNIIVRPAAGQGWRDSPSGAPLYPDQTKGVLITQSGNTGTVFTVNNTDVTIDGLQIVNLAVLAAFNHAGGTNVVVKNVLASSPGTATGDGTFIGNGCKFINCLGINSATGNGFVDFANNSEFHNCTAVAPGGGGYRGFRGNYTTPLYLNCASFGSAVAFANTTNTSSNYNVASDATAPGANSLQNKIFANQFVSTANDFRPKAGADLINAGTPDTANTGGVDIKNQTRSATTPTVGAYEYIASGSGATLIGISAAFVTGSLAPSATLALTGQSAAFVTGSIGPTLSPALTGLSLAFGQGSLGPSMALGIVGQSMTFATGTITPSGAGNVTVPLVGQAASFALGSVAPSINATITGQPVAFTAGSVLASLSSALLGSSLTSALGTLGKSVTGFLSGVAGIFNTGNIVGPSLAGPGVYFYTLMRMSVIFSSSSAKLPIYASAAKSAVIYLASLMRLSTFYSSSSFEPTPIYLTSDFLQ